jgi:hypothetical protein
MNGCLSPGLCGAARPEQESGVRSQESELPMNGCLSPGLCGAARPEQYAAALPWLAG